MRARQSACCGAIEPNFAAGGSGAFIRFMLLAVLDALREGTPQECPQVTPQERRLLDVLHREMSSIELLEALGLGDRKRLREACLRPALEAGLIERTSPKRRARGTSAIV